MIPSSLLVEGFLKIMNSMLYGSPQSELHFACIRKHVKYYFCDFLVNDHLLQMAKFYFGFFFSSYFLQIKTSKCLLS
jgi:hypothetical protein